VWQTSKSRDRSRSRAKYQGYIERQEEEIARHGQSENLRLPPDVDYSRLRGLSVEAQQKLNQHHPETVGQASRIPGSPLRRSPILLVHLKRGFAGARAAPNGTEEPDRAGGRADEPCAAARQGLAELGSSCPLGSEKLLAYLDLIQKWNRVYNLTAVREPADAYAASARQSRDRSALSGSSLLDVGSGAGLPGIPVAIARPRCR
jgi:hypothetical protein